MSFDIQKTASASAWSTIRKNLDLNAAKHLLTAFAGTYSEPSLSDDGMELLAYDSDSLHLLRIVAAPGL
jgi:hypothetical protein